MATTQREFNILIDRGLDRGLRKVHGVHPVLLVEKIIRERIFDSMYFKRYCFNMNLLTFVEQAAKLQLIGTYVNSNNTLPTRFICLLLKLLQLQPSKEIIEYFISQKHFKYLTALLLVYIRMTYESVDVYKTLEPFLADYRKLRIRNPFSQSVELGYVDTLIEELLNYEDNKFLGMSLPRLVSREQLEEQDLLEYRESVADIDEE